MAQSSISRFSKLATDPLRNFRFLAVFRAGKDTAAVFDSRITDFSGGFSSISGLSIETNSIQYREGGMNTTLHQVPGQTQFRPITFSRGAIYGQEQAIVWMRGLFATLNGEGIAGSDGKSFRCDIDIYVLDHPVTGAPNLTAGDVISSGSYKMQFTVHNAWITSLNYTDLNASGNEIIYETMTVVHEGLTVGYYGKSTQPA
jgi:phage tail-like protein